MSKNLSIKGVVATIFIPLLLLLLCTSALANTIIVDINGGGDTTSIQMAIDVAEPGDTILVRSGTYAPFRISQNLITLQGEDRSKTIINEGVCKAEGVSDITISGFTIQNGYVKLEDMNNLRITDNQFKNVRVEIECDSSIVHSNAFLKSVIILRGNDNSLDKNRFEDIYVDYRTSKISGDNCTVSNNVFMEHPLEMGHYHISRRFTTKNSMRSAKIENNNFNESEFTLDDGCVTNNTFNPSETASFYRLKINSHNCLINRNNISDFSVGIDLFGDHNNISENTIYACYSEGIDIFGDSNEINKNTITQCGCGISLYGYTSNGKKTGSENNVITCNTISSNKEGAVIKSPNNKIYKNNFKNREKNAVSECSNIWDNGKEGNYWSDYTGSDANGDGIGDTPYINIGAGCRDNYPIMQMLTPTQMETPPASTHTKASLLTFEELITAKEKLGTLEEKYIELEKRLGAYGHMDPSEIEGNYDSIRNDLIELRDEFLSLKEVCLEFCNDNEELGSIKNPDTYVFNEELFNAMIEEVDGWYELSEDYLNIHKSFRQYIFYKNIANRPRFPTIIGYETYECDDEYYKIHRIFNRDVKDYHGYLLVSKYGNSKDFYTLPVGYVEWYGNRCKRVQKLKQTSSDPEIYLCKTESDKVSSSYYDVAIISDGFLIKYNDKPLEGPSGLFPGGILYSYNEISEMLIRDVDFSSLEDGLS